MNIKIERASWNISDKSDNENLEFVLEKNYS